MSEPAPFMSAPLLDRLEADLHHTLELDIDALRNTGHGEALSSARMIRGSGLGA